MRVPVPGDWDGESYQCIKLQWPDSAAWDHILTGLLTGIARGYFWDVPDKAANDAIKAIAWSVLAKNLPFHACEGAVSGETDNDTITKIIMSSGGDGESEEIDLWAVTDVTIVDGKLVLHYGPCCRKTVEGELTASGGSTDISGEGNNPYDDVIDPATGQPYTGYACGKAAALVDTVWVAMDNLIASASDPTSVIHAITSGQPEISFDKLDLWGAYLTYVSTSLEDEIDPLDMIGFEGGDNLWDTEDILSLDRKQTWKCRLASRLENTTTVTDAELDALRVTASQIYSMGIASMINKIIAAIGKGDLKTMGAAGAMLQADCECPDLHEIPAWAPAWPVGVTWAHALDFTTHHHEFAARVGRGSYVPGTGFQRAMGGTTYEKGAGAAISWSGAQTGNLTRVAYLAVEFETVVEGFTELDGNGYVFALGGASGYTYKQNDLPMRALYEKQFVVGAQHWDDTQALNLGDFGFEGYGGPGIQGQQTITRMWIAGTGPSPMATEIDLIP